MKSLYIYLRRNLSLRMNLFIIFTARYAEGWQHHVFVETGPNLQAPTRLLDFRNNFISEL